MKSDVKSPGPDQVEQAIASFTAVLEDLQSGHRRLEQRAERVEAELCAANEELGRKVIELDRVKRHLEAILAAIPTGVVVYDADGRIGRTNDAALEILGVPDGSLSGAVGVPGLAGSAADGQLAEVVCADGRSRVLARRFSPVQLEGGTPAGGVEVLDDRTDLERAKERLHRFDKMAALGTMAGGIAHEIRNPLHGIQGFAQLLLREVDGHPRAHKHAERIQEGVAEIEAIVASMLGIAGDGALRLERFNARAVVREAVEAVLRDHESPPWDLQLVGPAVNLQADRIKLRQAVRNLVANACEVQPQGGPVRVETREESGDLIVSIADGGPGVSAEDRERIYDPFFTTRAEGTGMGLALVQRVAQLHGGALELAPAPGPLGGAEFTLRIPLKTTQPER